MKRVLWSLVLFPALLLLNSCGSSGPSPVITINPTGATLNVNTQQQFTATIENLSSTLVNWEVNGTIGGNATYGTITTGGLYTAPAAVPTGNLNVVTITAIAQAQTSLTTTADVTIVPAAAITISCSANCGANPNAPTVAAGGQVSFLASVGNSAQNTAVNWYVNQYLGGNSTVGVINGGNYVAPPIPPAGGVVTVTAVEANDVTQSASEQMTITLGTATMAGSYTFSVSGTNASGPFARAGYFTTSVGGYLSGVETLNVPGLSPSTVSFTGLYSVGGDGRGVMQFCEYIGANTCTSSATNNQVSSQYRVVVLSTKQVQIIPFDVNTAGMGEADLVPAGTLAFGPSDLTGYYTFDFRGNSSPGTSESIVGYFFADGNTHVTAGEMDVNNGGAVSHFTLNSSTYQLPSNNQGTIALVSSGGPTLNLAFYMVSPGHAKFVQTVATPVLAGDGFTQSTPGSWSAASLAANAPFVFKVLGSGASGGFASAGRFIADGGGNIVAGSVLDQNYSGSVSLNDSVSGTYTIDTNGRGTITLNNGATNTYIFYMISQDDAVLEQVGGFVADGVLVPESGGPFSATTLTGSYGFNANGVLVSGAVKESIIGQFLANGAGAAPSGTLDINDLGSFTASEPISSGTYSSINSTTGRGLLNFNPAYDNRSYAIYFVSPTQAFVVGIDGVRVASGTVNKQF